MSSCSAALTTEVGCLNHHNALPDDANVSKNSECPSEHKQDDEHDEEEEEDVDFNPFLKETSSQEASSSLSSEIEGLDAGVVESGGNTSAALATTLLSKAANQEEDYGVGDSEYGEEIVMQTTVSSGGADKIGSEKTLSSGLQDGKSVLISQPENETFCEKENGSSSGIDVVNDVIFGELSSISHSRKLAMDIDDEDAICRRTRARYSLASFTLDELETFLQETDDEDDLQNVDDEEEYRKFLAAVLQGGDGDHQLEEKTGNIDDEDEDNDADFELEIEEALESDVDENIRGENQEPENEATGRRPETRQNRRQKVSVCYKKKLSGKLNRPLRPLLPSAPIAPFPALDGNKIILESASHCLFSSVHNGFLNGFTPHQIGQLHCLIHEHVQLLIQVFSLCVLEPSREHIASQVQGLLLEMLHKRDQALVWRRIPYPSFYFCPPYIHPSVPDEVSKNMPAQSTIESSSAFDAQSECSLGNNMVLPSDNNFPSKDRYGYGSSGQVGHFQTTEGSLWVPFVSGPVLSVTDVAPLNLVGNYMDDVSTAVREYQRGYIGGSCDTRFEREPLFPFQSFQSSTEVNGEVPRGIVPPVSKLARSSGSDQTPRKTMAATLVERTKKQSVAPVPKKIAKLAQRFFPMFNPGLYPHKPPPASVANRVLFTEAEDQLLAMGLMECNTDWKAIQQRFLPCKSKHQIFVRQKNRSSSKAPENPIKAVRRMKNSPLTAEEKARIEEGLKFYKLDWMSVWNFVVPYRDPSLLPRQWRVATGTQKSYKTDADKKEKRRLYELKRRLSKRRKTSSEKEDCSTDNAGGENNSGDDCIDNEDEAYVHEAFLADWRPSTSGVPLELPVSNFGETPPPTYFLSQEGSNVGARINNSGPRDPQPQIRHKFPVSLKHSQHLHTPSHVSLTSFKSQVCLRPYRARRTNRARLVKLAPDLPPVNLPPSVRVMSQSAFKSYQGGPANQNVVPKRPCAANVGHSHPIKAGQLNSNPGKSGMVHLQPQDSGVGDKFVAEEKDESDLQMHPLLFQAPEDGRLPYYPLNCSTSASSSFNFFSRNQPQLNFSLFHNHQKANQTLNFFEESLKSKERSSSFGIDFHPLLQRTDDVNSDSVTAHSVAHRSANSEFLRDRWAQLQNPIDPVLTTSRINSSSVATSSIPYSPSAKTNDLDLEMHLSFTSRKEKAGETRDVTEHNMTRSTVSAQDSGTLGTEHPMDSVYRPSECTPAASNSGVHALVNRVRVNNIGDQSLPEIVMEQEELSDSEEEIGEHVEFECEEMADSEGEEGSDPEQIGNIRNKEVPNAAMEKISIDADFDDQQHEPRPHDNSEGNAGGSSESSRFRLGITEQERDNRSSSLHLNLNSCPPGSPLMKPKDSAGNNRAASRFSRSCKNTTPSAHVTLLKDQQSNLDSLAVAPLRKPRKRAQRTDSNLRTGRARKIDASLNTGATVEISNPVSTNEFG